MRLSADTKSADYSPTAIYAKVTLDGVELRNCIAADEEAGECIVHAMDDNGKLIIVDGELMVKTVHGKVEITFPGVA